MKRMLRTLGIGAATALGVIALAGQPVVAESTGPGEAIQQTTPRLAHADIQNQAQGMSSGMMMGGGMGHLKGGGHGSGMMGHDTGHCGAEKDLSAEDVRKIIEGRLAWNGNKRLKVGEVTKKDDDTYLVDIVTVDDSLVERLEMDRKTGATHRAD